jgi:hypothetical protein
MAAIENKIGDFEFITLQGPPPDTLHEAVEVVARRGVDGVALWKSGSRGNPFSWTAGVDIDNFTQAMRQMEEYRELEGADPVKVVFNDHDLSTEEELKFAVLRVSRRMVKKITSASGGLSASAGAWLETEWTLIPIDESQTV